MWLDIKLRMLLINNMNSLTRVLRPHWGEVQYTYTYDTHMHMCFHNVCVFFKKKTCYGKLFYFIDIKE